MAAIIIAAIEVPVRSNHRYGTFPKKAANPS